MKTTYNNPTSQPQMSFGDALIKAKQLLDERLDHIEHIKRVIADTDWTYHSFELDGSINLWCEKSRIKWNIPSSFDFLSIPATNAPREPFFTGTVEDAERWLETPPLTGKELTCFISNMGAVKDD